MRKDAPNGVDYKVDENAAEQQKAYPDIMPLVMEAARRYDELRRASALVPDGVSLKPTGAKPSALPGAKDVRFLRAVWTQACSGSTPEQCEAAVTADSYRIRALLAHWVEEGSLQLK